jgi:hypothetical protein
MAVLRRGIAPRLLYSQVENTAAWALGEARVASEWLATALTLEDRWREPEARDDYLRVMLAAHYTTVATFVPTDVDTHIRHHVWQEIDTARELESAIDVVAEAASWDPRFVSARVLEVEGAGAISGHAGEWLAVRAGALGRALAIGADDLAERLAAEIEREVAREADAFERVREDPVKALSLATISAHNCGDLSRVIEAWPKNTPRTSEFIARFAKLGHEDPTRFGGVHHLCGHLNKQVMASENHRFLALREPRALRRSRALLLPIGPFFDRWGETIGSSELLDEKERASVLAALLFGLDAGVDRWGYHRAVAGLHRRSPGGIERLAPHVPSRLRKLVFKGPVRDALRVDESAFLARIASAYRAALGSYRASA